MEILGKEEEIAMNESINGFAFREIASHADGNGPVTILRESMAEDFILRVYPPTPELQARIDEYNETHNRTDYEDKITKEASQRSCF